MTEENKNLVGLVCKNIEDGDLGKAMFLLEKDEAVNPETKMGLYFKIAEQAIEDMNEIMAKDNYDVNTFNLVNSYAERSFKNVNALERKQKYNRLAQMI